MKTAKKGTVAVIPEDLKQRYEKLASYKPMEVAVTDIWVRDWLALIERIARAESKVTALEAERLQAKPVSKQITTGGISGTPFTCGPRCVDGKERR